MFYFLILVLTNILRDKNSPRYSWVEKVKGLTIAKFKGKENKWNVSFISSAGEDLNKRSVS